MPSAVVRSLVTALAATGLGIVGPIAITAALLFADGLPQRLAFGAPEVATPPLPPGRDLAWLDLPAPVAPSAPAAGPPARRAAGASPSGPTPARVSKQAVPTDAPNPAPAAQSTRAVGATPATPASRATRATPASVPASSVRTIRSAPPACNNSGRCRVR